MFKRWSLIACAGIMAISLSTSTASSQSDVSSADDETLADIRLQLLNLYGQMEQLRRQLIPSRSAQKEIGISDLGALRQLDALEKELRQAISKIEELEFQILRIASDGQNQINDLEFMLAEISGGDFGQLSEGDPLGTPVVGNEAVSDEVKSPAVVTDLSILEESLFNEAFATYQRGQLQLAQKQFLDLIDAYPKGRFVADAQYFIGEIYVVEGLWEKAGRAFFASFENNQDGPMSPKALLRLGESLTELDRKQDACEILNNVGTFFPDSGEAGLADAEVAKLDCD